MDLFFRLEINQMAVFNILYKIIMNCTKEYTKYYSYGEILYYTLLTLQLIYIYFVTLLRKDKYNIS